MFLFVFRSIKYQSSFWQKAGISVSLVCVFLFNTSVQAMTYN